MTLWSRLRYYNHECIRCRYYSQPLRLQMRINSANVKPASTNQRVSPTPWLIQQSDSREGGGAEPPVSYASANTLIHYLVWCIIFKQVINLGKWFYCRKEDIPGPVCGIVLVHVHTYPQFKHVFECKTAVVGVSGHSASQYNNKAFGSTSTSQPIASYLRNLQCTPREVTI